MASVHSHIKNWLRLGPELESVLLVCSKLTSCRSVDWSVLSVENFNVELDKKSMFHVNQKVQLKFAELAQAFVGFQSADHERSPDIILSCCLAVKLVSSYVLFRRVLCVCISDVQARRLSCLCLVWAENSQFSLCKKGKLEEHWL